MVWEFALPPPQIITITKYNSTRGPRGLTGYTSKQPRAPYHKAPSMLYVCSQSRAVALEHYTESFGERLEYPIFFDVERDTLFMADGRTLDAFYRKTSRLEGEPQDIEDSIRHMMIATSNVVDNNTIENLLQFNLKTLQLEDCSSHHPYSTYEADGEHYFEWKVLRQELRRGWKFAAKEEGRKPTLITRLTRQKMFDMSEIGPEYKAQRAAYDLEFRQAIRAIIPEDVSDLMVSHLAEYVLPPIFNGMPTYRNDGYHSQAGRIDILKKYSAGLIEPHYCKICALALGWEWKD